jgi:regulator of replication initiation timing
MLIELLVLLVFLAMAFAFVKDGEKRYDRLQEDLAEARQQIEALQRENGRLAEANHLLQEENEALQKSLRRFIASHTGTLPANEKLILVRQVTFNAQAARTSEAERIIEERQTENAVLRNKLTAAGKGGSDLPRCAVASGRFVARVDLLPDGRFQVSPKWPVAAAAEVAKVPGLTAIASATPLNAQTFRRLAAQAQNWGKSQAIPCGFSVEVFSRHSQLQMYKRQYQTVGTYFYPAMR